MDTKINPSSTGAVLVTIAAASLFIMLSLNQINNIVHGELYNYGLEFTYRWAMPYWVLSGVIFGLCWVNISIAIVATLYIFKKSRTHTEARRYENIQEPTRCEEEEEQRRLAEYVQPQIYEQEPATQKGTSRTRETELAEKNTQQTQATKNPQESHNSPTSQRETEQEEEPATESGEVAILNKENEEKQGIV